MVQTVVARSTIEQRLLTDQSVFARIVICGLKHGDMVFAVRWLRIGLNILGSCQSCCRSQTEEEQD
jgi:hypothetical protein